MHRKERMDCFVASAPRNGVDDDVPPTDVIPRPYAQLRTRTGGSSTPRDFVSITDASEYWIVRRSLSSGARSRDPVADDDERGHSRDIICPRFCKFIGPPKERGRREDRVRAAPAVPCAKVDKKTHTSIQVQRKHPGLPCAMCYSLFRALPGETRACLSPSPA
jgi:hypothetical protein